MLSDICETFRTVNIYLKIKKKCLFLYLWTCGYFSYTAGIKEREQQSIYNYILMLHAPLESNY